MRPFSCQSHAALVAAVLTACFAPASVFAQGSFAPSGFAPPTIQLKPSVMGTDLTQPPVPNGLLPTKQSSRVAPADVDYEIIDADG